MLGLELWGDGLLQIMSSWSSKLERPRLAVLVFEEAPDCARAAQADVNDEAILLTLVVVRGGEYMCLGSRAS